MDAEAAAVAAERQLATQKGLHAAAADAAAGSGARGAPPPDPRVAFMLLVGVVQWLQSCALVVGRGHCGTPRYVLEYCNTLLTALLPLRVLSAVPPLPLRESFVGVEYCNT